MKDFIHVKKQSEGRRVGFETPVKGKTFKQAKLAVSGRKLKIYEANDVSEASAITAPTSAKRGRPRKAAPVKIKFPPSNKRKAKVNASAVIK